MVDIAHWLIRYKKVERVTAIARRGPVERKYNPKEIRAVCSNMDHEGIAWRIRPIKERLAAVGQNADEVLASLTAEFTKCEQTDSPQKWAFVFASQAGARGRQQPGAALEMEENKLSRRRRYAAVGPKQYYEFPVDSVVLAVGDRVDDTVGTPYKNGVYVTNPTKTGNDPDDSLFQAYDEKSGQVLDGVFLAGWARKASEGPVGIAKRDGDWCAEVMARYLATKINWQRRPGAGDVVGSYNLVEGTKEQAGGSGKP